MVESDTLKKKKLQEKINVQMAREMEEQLAREDQRMNEQIDRDAEIARIHAEEELQMLIDGLDRNNETIAKYLQEYEQFAADVSIRENIDMINKLVKYQDHYAKVLKYQSQQRKPLFKKQQTEFYMSVLKSNSGWKTKHFKGMSLEEIREKFIPVWKQIEDFVPMASKEERERFKRKRIRLEQDSAKKMKTSEEVLEEDLKAMMQDQEIFMLVEKDYPLRKGIGIVMISNKLQVENYSQMANDLIQKIHKIANIKKFPLPKSFPTASEDRFPLLSERDAPAEEVCTADEVKARERSVRAEDGPTVSDISGGRSTYLGVVLGLRGNNGCRHNQIEDNPPILELNIILDVLKGSHVNLRPFIRYKSLGEIQSIRGIQNNFIFPEEYKFLTHGITLHILRNNLTFQRTTASEDLTYKEKIHEECDIRATNIILPPDVYTLERESKLYNEFDRFISEKGETIHSYYLRLAQLIADMNTIGMTMQKLQVNTKLSIIFHLNGTDDLDASEFDCDEAPFASVVLMAKLSTYDSEAVQGTTSPEQQDALIMSVIKEMSNQAKQCNVVNKENKTVNESLTAELERYKELVKNFEERQKFDLNDREKYTDSQMQDQKQPTLYCGQTIVKKHDALFVSNSEETLELAEASRCVVPAINDNLAYAEMKQSYIDEYSKVFELEDVMCISMYFDVENKCVVPAINNNLAYAEMEQSYIDEYSKVFELEGELSKKKNMVEKELLVNVNATYPSSPNKNENLVSSAKLNKTKTVRFEEPKKSTSDTPNQADSRKTKITNPPLLNSIGVKKSTSGSESQPSGNTKKNRISRTASSNQNTHAKSRPTKNNKKQEWKPTGYVFTYVGHR
nr:hypothetical protein [Tanacetum cinerariifolium]